MRAWKTKPDIIQRYNDSVPTTRDKYRFIRFLARVVPSSFLPPIWKFTRDGHDQILLSSLRISSTSVVVDCGGYIGEFASKVSAKANCEIHIFEPVPAFVEVLKDRFRENNRVKIHAYALGSESRELRLILGGEATSEFLSGQSVNCVMKSIDRTPIVDIPHIDLFAVNIEGGEYELIPALFEAHILPKVSHILVQFHRSGPNYAVRRQECRELLKLTHIQEWCYDYVWESWRLRLDP